jgi:hypothetical protein
MFMKLAIPDFDFLIFLISPFQTSVHRHSNKIPGIGKRTDHRTVVKALEINVI